jgi:peptidoglycan biosynthesis protein MviN/MurJ (putative lipid II flippase)
LVAAVIPLSLLFAAVAPQLVSLAYEYGDFDTRSRQLTVSALDGLVVGIAAVALSLVLFRMLQAVSQLREIVVVSLVAVILNAVTSIAGGVWIGLYGVTLSTSLVAVALVALQVQRLSRTLGDVWGSKAFRRAVLPTLGCSLVSMAVVAANHKELLGDFWRGAVLVSLAAVSAVYLKRLRQEFA